MSYDTIYTCDGCGRKEPWERVQRTWNEIHAHAKGFGRRRADDHCHVCSTACERRVLLKLAGQQPTADQAEAEARAAWPDLAKQFDEQEAAHAREAESWRANRDFLELEVTRLRAELVETKATKASRPVTHEELRDLLRGLVTGQPGLARTKAEIQDRIERHRRDLDAWADDGRHGLTSLVPTEPDKEERDAVRRELKAAISVLEWVLEETR